MSEPIDPTPNEERDLKADFGEYMSGALLISMMLSMANNDQFQERMRAVRERYAENLRAMKSLSDANMRQMQELNEANLSQSEENMRLIREGKIKEANEATQQRSAENMRLMAERSAANMREMKSWWFRDEESASYQPSADAEIFPEPPPPSDAAPADSEPAVEEPNHELLQQIDELIAQSEAECHLESGVEHAKKSLDLVLEALQTDPQNYELLWRASCSAGLYAENIYGMEVSGWETICKEWGKRGIDFAEQAKQANPERVEAYFWQSFCIGQYAEVTGVLTALKENFMGMMAKNLKRALEIDKFYNDSAPLMVNAMYYHTLPKIAGGDAKKAMAYFREFDEHTTWTVAKVKNRMVSAQFLMRQKDRSFLPRARQLLEEAVVMPDVQPRYRKEIDALLQKLPA